MYKVIIADDEPIIRKGLTNTIEWDALGMEISGEASNGIEALGLVKTLMPQILITDIKMPEMDGLELIEEINRQGINVKIIILSGYSDYNLLKRAIKLRVESYLLKPIDNDELVSVLSDTVNNIEKERFSDIQYRQGMEILKINTLGRLVSNNISYSEFTEKARILNMQFPGDEFLAAVCSVGNRYDFLPLSEDGQLDILAILDVCKTVVNSHKIGSVFINPEGYIVFIINNYEKGLSYETVSSAMNEIAETVDTKLKIPVSVGIGTKVDCIWDIHRSYGSALKCLEYGIFNQKKKVFCFEDLNDFKLYRSDPRLDVNFESVENFIRLGRKEELFENVCGTFKKLYSLDNLSIDFMRDVVIQFILHIIKVFSDHNMSPSDILSKINFSYPVMLSLRQLCDFEKYVHALCESSLSLRNSMQSKMNKVVKEVMTFVNGHFSEAITLKQLASKYYINTSYLGQLFKKETGEYFIDYINKLRVNKAKELLVNSNIKVFEIAQIVGFTDYHYFVKIFKKIAGVNPSAIKG